MEPPKHPIYPVELPAHTHPESVFANPVHPPSMRYICPHALPQSDEFSYTKVQDIVTNRTAEGYE
jgi:hypothetical protein